MIVDIAEEDVNTLKRLWCKYFGSLNCGDPTPPSGGSRPGLYFGYYGGGVASQFADHCNLLHVGSWGDWTTPAGRAALTQSMIDQMNAGRDAGIKHVMITLDWCLFTPAPLQLLPMVVRQQNLIAFFDALRAGGVINLVTAIYTVDEPDVMGLDANEVTTANAAIREITVHYPELNGKPLVVTYGVQGTPGIGTYDWCGYDNYGTGVSGYNNFLSKLTPTQKVVLVPGGCDPWREDPAIFNSKAQAETRVVFIMPFIWRDDAGVTSIHVNGMAPQYAAVGKPIKDANP
jgi:hypothetical protein